MSKKILWIKDFKNSVLCPKCNQQFNWENYDEEQDDFIANNTYCPICGALNVIDEDVPDRCKECDYFDSFTNDCEINYNCKIAEQERNVSEGLKKAAEQMQKIRSGELHKITWRDYIIREKAYTDITLEDVLEDPLGHEAYNKGYIDGSSQALTDSGINLAVDHIREEAIKEFIEQCKDNGWLKDFVGCLYEELDAYKEKNNDRNGNG